MNRGELKSKIDLFQSVSHFSDDDRENIRRYGHLLVPHVSKVTAQFYDRLTAEPETARYIEGRVDQLKKTHTKWMESVLTSELNEQFVESQLRIGRVHVEAKIPPLFVAASLSFMRSVFPRIIEEELADIDGCTGALAGTVLKVLDLCQYLIDHAYEQDRFNRITHATGLSLPLLENLISLRPRKKERA